MKQMVVVLVLLINGLLMMAVLASAQTPTRRAADVASWGTSLTSIALDTKASWGCAERVHCLTMQGLRTGATYGIVWGLKTLIHESRPCAPSCGSDNANTSFPSGHTAVAIQALGGPSAALVLPLSIGTGGLRVLANKHYWWDTLAGAGVGLLTSRIR